MTGLPAGYSDHLSGDHTGGEDFDDDLVDQNLLDHQALLDHRALVGEPNDVVDEQAPQLMFSSVNRFVVDHLAPMYRRR